MRQRAWFWRYWRITPSEYRNLTVAEHRAMVAVMREEARQKRKTVARRG